MTDTPIWHTANGEPVPTPEELQPALAADKKYVHGAVLLLNGTFRSWLFNILAPDTITGSINAVFLAHPSAVQAWLGDTVLVNDHPVPTPPPGIPPTAPNLPTPPERPRPPELPPLP